jgi:hypothetical protein
MKRSFFSVLAAFLSVFVMVPFSSKGADVSVGASAWYATWNFKQKATTNSESKTLTMGPELMAGPSLSVRFAQDWTLASVFLYSATPYKMEQGSSSGGNMDLHRMDSDTTLNYSINRYFKIFPGVKYMRFSYSDGHHQSVGPGFGVGTTIPLLDSLFVIVNGSGSYLFGDHKNSGTSSEGFREYGYNVNAGLAYYIQAISTTVNVGYRYQYFYSKFDSNTNNGNLDHVFRGLSMSIIYSF